MSLRPSEGAPVVRVRLPDGTFLRTDEMTDEILKRRVGKALTRTDFDSGDRALSISYRLGNVTAYFNGNTLTLMLIDAWWTRGIGPVDRTPPSVPAIGPIDKEKFYTLPIHEVELKELLGQPIDEHIGWFNT
jgi:hypothetical protein